MSDHHPTVRDLLGREPTLFEEELCIFLIRCGRRDLVEYVLFGGRADGADAIRATYDVADLIVEHWDSLNTIHQQSIRAELRRLLWRIGREKLSGTWAEAASAILRLDEQRRGR